MGISYKFSPGRKLFCHRFRQHDHRKNEYRSAFGLRYFILSFKKNLSSFPEVNRGFPDIADCRVAH